MPALLPRQKAAPWLTLFGRAHCVKDPRVSLPLAGEGAQCSHWADEVESKGFSRFYTELITFMTAINHKVDADISTAENTFLN